MNIFQRTFNAVKQRFSQEPHLPEVITVTPFQVQSRMWFKLGPIPSIIEAQREAEFFRKVAAMGAEVAHGAKRKYEIEKLNELHKSFSIMQRDSAQGRKVRSCILCSATIALCNGHALPRDVINAMKGDIAWADVRELCPKCDVSGMWNPFTWQDPREHQDLFNRRNTIQ